MWLPSFDHSAGWNRLPREESKVDTVMMRNSSFTEEGDESVKSLLSAEEGWHGDKDKDHRRFYHLSRWLHYPEFTASAGNFVAKCRKQCTRRCLLTSMTIFWLLLFLYYLIYKHRMELAGRKFNEDLKYIRENPYLDAYLQLNQESCIVCPRRLKVECDIYSSTARPSDQLLVYFITTAPEHWRQRAAIRATWGASTTPRPVFMAGYTEDPATMELMLREAHVHQDLIVEDFVDNYWNLTLKTGFILKHFHELCPQADFLVKTDDDMFLQPEVIEERLSTADRDQLTGFVQRGTIPYRHPTDRYYLPYWMYNETVLPDFTSGWAYVLPGRRIPEIIDASLLVPMINLEDVFFTGIVARRMLGLDLICDEHFKAGTFHPGKPCSYKPLAAFHSLTYKQLLKIWPQLQLLTMNDCDTDLQLVRKKTVLEEDAETTNGYQRRINEGKV